MKHKKSVLKILSASCDYFEVSHGMAGNVPSIAAVAELELQNFKLITNER